MSVRRVASTCFLGSLAALGLSSCGGTTEEGGSGPAVVLEASTSAISLRAVQPERELFITDPSVIRSVPETVFDPAHPSGHEPSGAWSFGRLVHNLLPAGQRDSAAAASALVMAWLKRWEVDQLPNPAVDPARARPTVRKLLLEPWKAKSGCAEPENPGTDAACLLDFRQAPFALVAIVNRPDLRIVADDGSAIGGEGRFVFQVVGPTLAVGATSGAVEVMDPTPRPQKFTVIFEYALPVKNAGEAVQWAQAWHRLGDLPFGSAYNERLRALTQAFSGPDTDRRRPNGSALNQLRTNEVALAGARFPQAGFVPARQVWELREFHLTTAGLEPHTVNLEPARDFDVSKSGQVGFEGTRTPELIAFLEANGPSVLASRHRLPEGMSANSSLVGSAPYGAWGKLSNPNPPGIPAQGQAHALGAVSIPVRDSFALNTCAGCHRHETDTRHFMHVTLLGAMEPADRVDDRSRIGVDPATPEETVVLSNFMRAEISPGGPRFQDFTALLEMKSRDLREAEGPRVCAR